MKQRVYQLYRQWRYPTTEGIIERECPSLGRDGESNYSHSIWDRFQWHLTIAVIFHLSNTLLTVLAAEDRFQLWDSDQSLASAADLPQLEQTTFHVIKQWDRENDGYTFLHGIGLAWHQGRLFASFGHNKGEENTVSEEAHYRVSSDGGSTWSPISVIDSGDEPHLAVSHGVFLSRPNQLWAFHGAYFHKMERIHTRGYRFDSERNRWIPIGRILADGFWPMNQPVAMENGNWIMPGFLGGPYDGQAVFPAAVAISHGEDFSQWDLIRIPTDPKIKRMWGESALWVDGQTIHNVARYGGEATALGAVSHDFGRTWSPSSVTNLPMVAAKPAAGVLSTGQRYLIATSASDNGNLRHPLTIALSRPNEDRFSQIFVIRRTQNDPHPGESAAKLSLAYPYAIEHNGKLYVGYSNNGGRRANLNSAELAVLSVAELSQRLD